MNRALSGVAAVVVMVVVAFGYACSSEEDEELSYDCDGDLQTNTVEASEWVQEHSDIEYYHYASDPDADVVVLDLLDESEASLGELTIEGFFGVEQFDPDDPPQEGEGHRVEALFEPAGVGDPIEVTSDSVISNEAAEEFRTRTLMASGGDQVMVRADFKALDCYANEEGVGHPCAWPVNPFDDAFSVPTCGFDVNPDFPAAPNLRALEYRTPTDSDPGIGGYLYQVDGKEATFDAVEEGAAVQDSFDINQWLGESGAGAIIGTEAEQLFSTAYVDPAWMDHVEEHAAKCLAEELEESSSELETVRQGHHAPGLSCQDDLSWQHMAKASDDIDVVRQPGGGKCGEECADGCGKPHLRTFDGSSYAFHAAGEFYLSKATAGAPYGIQARMEPAGDLSCLDDVEACEQITVISAVAMQIGDVNVGLYRDEQPHLVIDGEPVDRVSDADLSGLPDGAQIHQSSGGSYRFDWPGGEALEAVVREHYLDVHGILPVERFGQIAGLWGNFTNLSSDDFRTRDGDIVEKPFTFDELYDEFADSWRIDADESYFVYDDGEDTTDFTIPELPEEEVSIEDLPDDLRMDAEAACSAVTGHPDQNWCIFDVVCMCDDELAHSTEDLGPHDSITDLDPIAPLTVTGDLCLGAPEGFEYTAADEPSCPPDTDPCVHVVREQSGVELGEALPVDATEEGIYAAADDLDDPVIDAGTEVDSYLIHVNEVPEGTGLLEGEALCSEDILGVVATDSGLEATDDLVGDDDADYDDGPRAPDFETDEFELLDSGSGVAVRFNAEDGITEIRVITEAAGE